MNQAGCYVICWWKQRADAMHEMLPEGLPEVLCSCDAQDSKSLETLKRVYAESKLATHGYCFGWRPGAMKRRKVSPESLLAMRRKNLRKTVEQRYPLFADEMEQRTLEAEAKKYSLEALRERASELESMEAEETQTMTEAMTPSQALVFLRQKFVVPFINDKVNDLHRQGIKSLVQNRASKLNRAESRVDQGKNRF